MRRHAFEIADLKNTHPQRDANFRVEAPRAARVNKDKVIELGLVAENTEDDFRSERGIPGIEAGACRVQQIGREGPVLYAQKDVKRHTAGGGDGDAQAFSVA